MRLLALTSSYRQNGNTARVVAMICDELQAQAAAAGEMVQVETLHLAHMDIHPCRGCRACFDRGEAHCPLKDDILAIRERIQAADVLLLASPVYVSDVNGVIKNLFDRLAFVCHRPEFAGKGAYIVATTGSSPTGHAIRTMQAVISWGMHLIGAQGFSTGALMADAELERRHRPRAQAVARRLLTAWRRGDAKRPSFFSLMTFRIQQMSWGKSDPSTLDYRYWSERGWLDAHRTFFIPHRAGRLKVAAARLVGSALGALWA